MIVDKNLVCKEMKCSHWIENFLGFLPGRCDREILILPIGKWCDYDKSNN